MFPLNHKRMQTVLLAKEFSSLMAWDGHSKDDVDHHFSNVSDTLEMLNFLGRNIDITDVFKAVILATLQSSKTKALTKAYSMILDNLEDSHDLSFEMIRRACVRKLRRRHDRCADRNPDRRPGTPHHASKDKAPRNLRSKGLLRADSLTSLLSLATFSQIVVSSLRGFSRPLALIPTTCTAHSQFELCSSPPSLTCLRRSTPTPTPTARTVGLTLKMMMILLLFLQKQKFSFRCIPVGIGTLLTGLGSTKKTHVIMFSP